MEPAQILKSPLVNLSKDFKLIEQNGKLSFDAFVEYIYDGKSVNIKSKVVIVSAENGTHDMLFLLNIKLIAMQFPEAFRNDRDKFTYNNRSIMINGTDRAAKNYMLSIHPVSEHGLL